MEINEFELTYKDTDLLKQYYDLISTEFTNPNEIDSYDTLVYRLENKTSPDISVAKVYLNENKDILGGILYDYYNDIQTIGGKFLVVNPKYRQQGIGTTIYRRMISLYKYYLRFTFIKVDKHSKCKPFWEKLGFTDTKIIYVQEALENKEPCTYFELWYKSFNGTVLQEKDINSFIEHYKKHATELPKKKESIPK